MMIFKSFYLQKPLLKSEEFGTCYAGRGRRSGTPRWGYPSHRYRGGPLPYEATGGYAAPTASAGQSCWDDDFSVTGHACMALTKTISAE